MIYTGSGAADLFHRRAALGIEVVCSCLRRIENVRGIGKHDDLHAHAMRETLDLSHVRGLHPAGQDVDLLFLVGCRFCKVMHQRLRHVGKSGDV